VALRFVPSESAFTYFETLKDYLASHGRPLAFYSDKHSIFRFDDDVQVAVEKRCGIVRNVGVVVDGLARQRNLAWPD